MSMEKAMLMEKFPEHLPFQRLVRSLCLDWPAWCLAAVVATKFMQIVSAVPIYFGAAELMSTQIVSYILTEKFVREKK